MVTDWKIELLKGIYDFTDVCEWGVEIEEVLGQTATARFVLQDRDVPAGVADFASVPGGPFNLEEIDVQVRIAGLDPLVFRGQLLYDEVELGQGFPWRRHQMSATDYQRAFFDHRMVGVPSGDLWWASPDADGEFVPVDPRPWLGNGLFYDGGDETGLLGMVSTFGGTVDMTTFVTAYVTTGFASDPLVVERTKPRAVLEQAAARVGGNLQYWLDPGLVSTGSWRFHWAIIPRWFEQETGAGALAGGMPATITPLERAPMDIDMDTPNGSTSIGARDLSWRFDYTNNCQQFWVNGGLGFAYDATSGAVDKKGTGWVGFGVVDTHGDGAAQELLDAPQSVDATSKVAAAVRAGNAVARGILRGKLTVGNDREHVDGWHVGQTFALTDSRLPGHLNNRRYVIQKVTTKLVPGQNWRIYDIEWGDAPIARSSSAHAPAGQSTTPSQKPLLPGRVWKIEYRKLTPNPDSDIAVTGQLLNDADEPRAVANVTVFLEVLTFDAEDNPVVPTEGTLSADTAVSDVMGRWFVTLSVGPGVGYSYKVQTTGPPD